MATEKIPIKYWLTSLRLTSRAGINQLVKIDYTEYPYDYERDYWINIGTNIVVDPDGNLEDKIELDDLADNTTYILRITDKRNRIIYTKFTTGTNIGLSDSPYYDKVIFPGQVYDFYGLDYTKVGMPNRTESGVFYYPCTSKAECNIDGADNWGSLCGMTKQGNYTVNCQDAPPIEKVTDSRGYSMAGYAFDNTEGKENPVWLAFPNLKYDEVSGTWKKWNAYWGDDGGGGIKASDVYSVGFAFYIRENITRDQILCYYDAREINGANTPNNINLSWKLYFTTENKLKITMTHYSGNSITQTISGNYSYDRNCWYFIYMYSNSNIHIYRMNEDSTINEGNYNFSEHLEVNEDFDSTNINTFMYTICSNNFDNLSSNAIVPFCFGSSTTDGVIIKSICANVMEPYLNSTFNKDTFNLINKVLNPDAYGLKLKISGTTSAGESWELMTENKYNLKNGTDKISFVVDPDLFSNVDTIKDTTYLNSGTAYIAITSAGEVLTSKTFTGFSYIDPDTNETIKVNGLINPSTYVQNSFDLTFSECESPVTSLAKYFFTKHGTWGGYNGGTNGNNIYFNGAGNLVLECHGDNYTGSLKGVGKESKAEVYTGYGEAVDYDKNTWDLRSNKLTARVGTALVSNKYFGYGRIDVTMKIPKNTWGVCPAIWLFHYIEVGDSDYRYNIAPYNERNRQGSVDDGYYRVINNEIDIELPSHLTNGTANTLTELQTAYFDIENLDDQVHIGITSGTQKGLYRLTDVLNPKVATSWTKIKSTVEKRYQPSFGNIKFNNWVGELNSGNGWCLPYGNVSAEEYYKGTNEDTADIKEEYLSQLTIGTEDTNGYADGHFHKWSIVWLPDRTLLFIDDNFIRENRGFVPFNIMKLTIAMWFPTMKANSNGVVDSDGIHGTTGATITNLRNNKDTYIGTWAGTNASFDVLHLEVSNIKYTKYNVGDDITINGKTTHISSEPSAYGESFPESGLRMFTE